MSPINPVRPTPACSPRDFFAAPYWVPSVMHFLFEQSYSDAAIHAIITYLEDTGTTADCNLLNDAADCRAVQRLLPRPRVAGVSRYEDIRTTKASL